MDALDFLNSSGSMKAADFLSEGSRTFTQKALDFLTMGHVHGEYGPETEVKFTPEGQMSKANVPTGDPGMFQDPVTALAMGGFAGAKAAGGLVSKAGAAGREALAWLTGGGSEVPSLAKSGVKGITKAVSAKPLAEAAEKRQAAGVLESITPEAKAAGTAEDFLMGKEAITGRIVEPGATSEAVGTVPSLQQLEVEVKGGLPAGNLPKYAEGSSINLEKLNASDEVKNFLNQRTIELEGAIGKRTISREETRAMAEELGWDVREAVKQWKQKGSFSSAEMDAARQLNMNAVDNLFQKIKNLPADRSGYTPELRAEFLDTMDMVRTTSQASSEAGRALNVHKRVLQNDPAFAEASARNRVMKAIEGKGAKKTDDIIDALKNLDTTNPADVNRFIYNVTKTPWQKLNDAAYNLWLNGLLSHPLSHIANVTSNALTLAYTVPERMLAAGIETARAGVTGTPRKLYFREGAEDIFSIAGGLGNGWSRFLNVLKKGEVGKFDRPMSGLPPKLEKYLPVRALSAEDAFFKGFIEHTELNRLAYRKARNEGLAGAELKDRIVELATTPTREMLEKVAARGEYLTYQKELGEVGKLVMRAKDVVPGLKYFIPFVKTPTNIAKFAMERTPINLPVVVAKALKGELKGERLSEELAKPLLGTAMATTIYMMAEQGLITGGQPKKKSEREERLNTGWHPYSLKVGDTYYSFGRMEPLASILGIAADFNQIEKDMKKEDKYNLAVGIIGAIKNNVSDKTFMQGFANLVNGIYDPGRFGQYIVNTLAGSIVPSISAGVERSVDPYVRDVRTALDAMQSRIPVAAESLPKKLTIWGDPIKRAGTGATRFASPVQISETKGSPVEKELVRLDIDIGLPARTLKGADLSPAQYWDMVRVSGQRAKGVLNNMIEKPGWKNIPDGIKEKIIRTVVDDFRNAYRAKMEAKLISEGKVKAIPKLY